MIDFKVLYALSPHVFGLEHDIGCDSKRSVVISCIGTSLEPWLLRQGEKTGKLEKRTKNILPGIRFVAFVA